jgi:hypothetical protein
MFQGFFQKFFRAHFGHLECLSASFRMYVSSLSFNLYICHLQFVSMRLRFMLYVCVSTFSYSEVDCSSSSADFSSLKVTVLYVMYLGVVKLWCQLACI